MACSGLERQRHGRVAGLRTHMLVCIASTILMTTAHILMKSSSFAQLAPSRLAAGIMTGMGFIGAGTIIRAHHSVRGLTTSACLWLTAALGVVIGSEEYMLAIKASIISYIILAFLGKMDTYMKTEAFQVLIVRTHPDSGQLNKIKKICNECGGKVMDTSIIRGKEKKHSVYRFHLKFEVQVDGDKIVDSLYELPEVEKVIWKKF